MVGDESQAAELVGELVDDVVPSLLEDLHELVWSGLLLAQRMNRDSFGGFTVQADADFRLGRQEDQFLVDIVPLESGNRREVEVVAADDGELVSDTDHARFEVADDDHALVVGLFDDAKLREVAQPQGSGCGDGSDQRQAERHLATSLSLCPR
jgi:hypothetical protein